MLLYIINYSFDGKAEFSASLLILQKSFYYADLINRKFKRTAFI